jgi:purine nucleosidase/pyrimidine-specific ribonucleoside hydrolase
MSAASGAAATAGSRVLIDTDPGIDDALALLFAFAAPGCRVVAVTVVAGNVPIETGTANLARILAVARPDPVPRVAAGAAGPAARDLVTAEAFHGSDGLGGLSLARDAAGSLAYPEGPLARDGRDAADLIVACARQWAGELVVVALGPLTNLAAAVDRDPGAMAGVARVVAMGGAVAVGGNVTAAAEYNMFVDPESAASVLAAGLRVTLVPLDVTHRVVWSRAAVGRLADAPSAVGRFAYRLGAAALARGAGEPALALHDPLALGVALDPTLVRTETLPVAVEQHGVLTRGMTVVDRRPPARRPDGWGCASVALEVDAARFISTFEETLWAGSR